MRHFLRLLFGLWFLTIGAIIVAMHLSWAVPCQAPIVQTARDTSFIIDTHTGVVVRQSLDNVSAFFRDAHYRRALLANVNNAETVHVSARVDDNQQHLFTSSANAVAVYWSADGLSLFVYEYFNASNRLVRQRLLRLNVMSGEVVQEYAIASNIIRQSIQRRYLYIDYPLENAEIRTASIDTLTGQLTVFENDLSYQFEGWSRDEAWLLLRYGDSLLLVDSVTGALHPLLDEPFIALNHPIWTDDSLWIRRYNVLGLQSAWRISLDDGSFHLEHDNLISLSVSPDDRWRLVGQRTDNHGMVQTLYDALTDSSYASLPIYSHDFSEDSACLLAETITHRNPIEANLHLIDLQTMTIVYTRNVSRSYSTYEYDWYDEN